MDKSTEEIFEALIHSNCLETEPATSSPESGDGLLLSLSQDGQQNFQFGPEVAHANLSPLQDEDEELKTQDTFGQFFGISSPSVSLQSSLENKLLVMLGGFGTPEYVLTWRRWVMPLGVPICALRASARHTQDNAYTGWVSPNASANGGQMAPWPTTSTMDAIPRKSLRPSRVATGRKGGYIGEILIGINSMYYPSEMVPSEGFQVNPLFSLWLMGFDPTEWASCAPQEMLSSPNSEPSGSEQ